MEHLVDLEEIVERALAGRAGQQPVQQVAVHNLPLVLGDRRRIACDLASRLRRSDWEAEGEVLRVSAALVAGRPAELRLELSAGTWREDVTFAVAGALFPIPR